MLAYTTFADITTFSIVPLLTPAKTPMFTSPAPRLIEFKLIKLVDPLTVTVRTLSSISNALSRMKAFKILKFLTIAFSEI